MTASQAETCARIWFGYDESPPGPGMVLVLRFHHDGESHWCSPEQALARVEDILDGGKPEDEWGWRMENMKIVLYGVWWESKARSEALAVYAKACSEALAVYDHIRSGAWAIYVKAYSEAGAAYDNMRSEMWGEEYPAEAWAAEWKEKP